MPRKVRNSSSKKSLINYNKISIPDKAKLYDKYDRKRDDLLYYLSAPTQQGEYYQSYAKFLPQAVPKSVCSAVLRDWQTMGAKNKGEIRGDGEATTNFDIRRVVVYGFDEMQWNESLLHIGQTIAKKYFPHMVLKDLELPQLLVYSGSAKGHYTWHRDSLTDSSYKYIRKMSMSILLNDSSEFEGGDFLLLDHVSSDGALECYNPPLRNIGDVIAFDSNTDHKVMPVTKGTRAVLVLWFLGEHNR